MLGVSLAVYVAPDGVIQQKQHRWELCCTVRHMTCKPCKRRICSVLMMCQTGQRFSRDRDTRRLVCILTALTKTTRRQPDAVSHQVSINFMLHQTSGAPTTCCFSVKAVQKYSKHENSQKSKISLDVSARRRHAGPSVRFINKEDISCIVFRRLNITRATLLQFATVKMMRRLLLPTLTLCSETGWANKFRFSQQVR